MTLTVRLLLLGIIVLGFDLLSCLMGEQQKQGIAVASAWTLPFPGGRQVSYRDGIIRIQLENQANLPTIPPLGTSCSEQVLNCIELKDTKTPKGWGAFCCDAPIPKHAFLGFYEGTLMDLSDPSSREIDKAILSLDQIPKHKSGYVLSLDGGETFLDGYDRAQDRTRFSPVHLNHADKTTPLCNCLRLLCEDSQNVAFFTSRTVAVGEELCFDYGANYWKGREAEKL